VARRIGYVRGKLLSAVPIVSLETANQTKQSIVWEGSLETVERLPGLARSIWCRFEDLAEMGSFAVHRVNNAVIKFGRFGTNRMAVGTAVPNTAPNFRCGEETREESGLSAIPPVCSTKSFTPTNIRPPSTNDHAGHPFMLRC
jgi:hypothetical protein